MEPNQIDILAFAVLGDLEQVDESEETRLSSQLRRDVRKTNRLDGIYLNLTFFHRIPAADFDVWARPDPNTARNLAAANSLAKPLRKHHEKSLYPAFRPVRYHVSTRLL